MKICIECGRELFDNDESCDRCNSNNIINEKEYKNIKKQPENHKTYREWIRTGNYSKG